MTTQTFGRRLSRSFVPTRRGLTKPDVVIVFGLLALIAAFAVPRLLEARKDQAARACRDRLAVLGRAVASYGNRNGGRLPGYTNILKIDGHGSYVDPATKVPTPVSWAVEILPDLERADLYAGWKQAASSPESTKLTDVYLEALVCPADSSARMTGASLSYVANTGMPDLPSSLPATPATGNDSSGTRKSASKGMPRDWQANGLFFDNFSDDPLIKTSNTTRGPMVYMRLELVRDPKDRTILLTENIDATSYRLTPSGDEANRFGHAEAAVGATYAIGSSGGTWDKPTMTPARASLAINADVGRGDGRDMDYCRPSSYHPGGVNVVYVAQNVQFLKENVAYFVLAKLMSSEDMAMRFPGTRDYAVPGDSIYRGHDDINP